MAEKQTAPKTPRREDLPSVADKGILENPQQGPHVSFNVHLGQSLGDSSIDYSEKNLMSHLEAIGARQSDSDKLSITVNSLSATRDGGYDNEHKVVKLRLRTTSPEKMDRALKHELQHWQDDIDGLITKPSTHYAIGLQAARIGAPVTGVLFGTSLGLNMANEYYATHNGTPFMPREALTDTTQALQYIQLGSLALSGFYYFNKSEQRARRAERRKSAEVFSIEPKLE